MNSENQSTLHQQLINLTSELHNKAIKTPYIENFSKSNFSKISYIGHLRALAIIYGTLENQLTNLEINNFLGNYSPKLSLILSDLEFLKANEVKDIIPAISIALQIADKIMLNSIENPYKLLGYLYSLEDSLNGGYVLKKYIPEIFKYQNDKAPKYFSFIDENFKNYWNTFVNNLNTKIIDNQKKEDIIAAAKEIFVDLIKIYDALFPVNEKTLGNHITSLNPEAGNYPIPTNPLEINAAITAGMNCWNEFPYYEKRYGERGRRFTVSDSVWLVTLCELEEDYAIKQVNWLANFLAIRGMPTYTMEFQMQELFNELSKSIPSNKYKYAKFLKASENIKSQRNYFINETTFENCNSIFYKYLGELKDSDKIWINLKKNIGKLIASSMVDDKNGIPDVRNSLVNWLKSKDIFPDNWILAIEKTCTEIEFILDKK